MLISGFSKGPKLYTKCSLCRTVKFSEGKECSVLFSSGSEVIILAERTMPKIVSKTKILHVRI